jgi:hypothetical protein
MIANDAHFGRSLKLKAIYFTLPSSHEQCSFSGCGLSNSKVALLLSSSHQLKNNVNAA